MVVVVSSAAHLEFLAVNFFLPPQTQLWRGSVTRKVPKYSNSAQAQLSAGQLAYSNCPAACGWCMAGNHVARFLCSRGPFAGAAAPSIHGLGLTVDSSEK